MKAEVINIADKMSKIDKYWTPKIIEQMNDYHFKLAKIKGEFTWHDPKLESEIQFISGVECCFCNYQKTRINLNQKKQITVIVIWRDRYDYNKFCVKWF